MDGSEREVRQMSIPNSLYLECPTCGEKTLHEVLRGKMSRAKDTMETTVKCQVCGTVQTTVVREPKTIHLPVVLSDMDKSRKMQLELAVDELVSLDDEMFIDDTNVIVTGIEQNGKRVTHAPAGEVQTIWVKRFDKVRVKISVNKTSKTLAAEVFALPDEEFYVGDTLQVGRDNVVIHNIKTTTGTVREGGVAARDIVRIYAKCMRTTYA
jgi:uncharacterized Zn finger protein